VLHQGGWIENEQVERFLRLAQIGVYVRANGFDPGEIQSVLGPASASQRQRRSGAIDGNHSRGPAGARVHGKPTGVSEAIEDTSPTGELA
jgi:hypothetical protein